MTNPSIFSYIKTQENTYQTEKIKLGDNWDWNCSDHLQLIYHLKNGVFYTGDNDYLRAFKNIMEPIIELANWTEDIEVKDIVFYIEGQDNRALSFLIKKYHDEVFVRKNNVDDLLDQITESDNTYGGVLVQNGSDMPEIIPLISIAFADQGDFLNGAMGFKYNFSPDGIRRMSKYGWGKERNGATISLDELAVLADASREASGTLNQRDNETTGKNIEVYIVRGSLPEAYLLDNDNMEDWYNQLHIVAYYTDKENKKQGVHLYRKPEDEGTLKFFTAAPVENRALGRGVGEKMIHPQVWTNFSEIHKMNMLEAGSKSLLQTDDETFVNKNAVQEMDNLEIATLAEGKRMDLIPTINVNNLQLHSSSINEWFEYAQLSGSAQDPMLGREPVSGTTFRGQERTVAQGRGSHDRKRGKRAKFIEIIYREMIIPRIVKELKGGKRFLASLSADELSWVADQVATNYANQKIKEMLLSGEIPTDEDKQMLKDTFREAFAKKGNKQMMEILRGELKDIEIGIGINVANKQKDLANLSDKLLSIFQFIFANPQGFQQAMQNPALAKSFNDILEFSGMNQADFMALTAPVKSAPVLEAPQQGEASPLQLTPEQNAA